jgi:hypothetical protein
MTMIDFEFGHLETILGTLDNLLDAVKRDIRSSEDPDGFGILDEGEAIIGLAFVACQNYLVARKKRRPKATYNCGPHHHSGLHVAHIINAGANYWKHNPEWPAAETEFNEQQERTAEVLRQVGAWHHDYRMSMLLAEISPTTSLTPLLGALDEWRSQLDPGGFIP